MAEDCLSVYAAIMEQPGELALSDVEKACPRWQCWVGVAGLLYARRPLTSPPAVIRSENAQDLLGQIRDWEDSHS